MYDSKFINFLKTGFLNMVVFDDQVSTEGDVIGECRINLSRLVRNEGIDQMLEIVSADKRVRGNLRVKVFWMDAKEHEQAANLARKGQAQQQSLIQESWKNDITLKITKKLRNKQMGLTAAFQVFDVDEDQIINFDDFERTLNGTLDLKLLPDEIKVYFSKLPQPLNRQNFESYFRRYLFGGVSLQEELEMQEEAYAKQDPDNFRGYVGSQQTVQMQLVKSEITSLLDRKLSLGIKLMDIYNEIDIRGDGEVGIFELKNWLLNYGLEVEEKDLIAFLNICDQRKQHKIQLVPFFELVLQGKHQ